MEEKLETYAYFYVSDFDCEPNEISKILELEPTEVFVKGELLNEKRDRRRLRSEWIYKSTLPLSEAFQDAHLENLINKLYKKKSKILELKSRYTIGINCVGTYINVNAGFNLSAELLLSCANLGVSIDFDLYTF